MKVTVLAENLQKNLTLVNHAISSKTQLPILANILLETYEGRIRLSSTDLDVGIQNTLSAEITEPGEITIPAKTFSELVSSLGNEKITITTQDTSVIVNSSHTKSSFQTLPAADFPQLYEQKGEQTATFTLEELKQDLMSVIFAASSETTRPALSGVLLRREAEGFLFVATDGFRLSLKHYPLVNSLPQDSDIIIPARILREVIALKQEGNILMYLSRQQNQVLFEQTDTVLIGRLIEAEYPPFEKIIPTEFSVRARFDREALLKAVKICAIFARDSANIITLALNRDKIIVSSESVGIGKNTVDVEAEIQGEENEIAFNARYLLDILTNSDKDDLVFEMTGPLNPGVFKVKEDPSFLHLIMPVRLQQ